MLGESVSESPEHRLCQFPKSQSVQMFFAAFKEEASALVHQKILSRSDASGIASAFARIAARLPSAVREETGPRDVTRQQDLAARLHAHADEVRKNKVWAPHVADELDEAARLLVATSSASVREESGAIRETCARICDGRRAGREPSDPRYLEATTCAKLIRDDYTFNRLAAAPSPNEEQG